MIKTALKILVILYIAILVLASGVLLGLIIDNHAISYYAVFENGDIVKVDSIIAVPISSADDVGRIWPEYYAETKISVDGKEIILRSELFLFCDNPEMEGRYAGKSVYYFD